MKSIIEYIKEEHIDYILKVSQDIQVALDAVKEGGFELFKDNFKKNNNTFPYVSSKDVKIGSITLNNKTAGLIAYAYPDALSKYREMHEDEAHNDFAHIFDFEVAPAYRSKGYSSKLIVGVIDELKKNKIEGVTLMAINQDVAKMYKSKYNFDYYEGCESDDCPMMSLKF